MIDTQYIYIYIIYILYRHIIIYTHINMDTDPQVIGFLGEQVDRVMATKVSGNEGSMGSMGI